jgi:hypothetical protein
VCSPVADVGESTTDGWPVPSEERPSVGRLMRRRRGIGRAGVPRAADSDVEDGEGEGEGNRCAFSVNLTAWGWFKRRGGGLGAKIKCKALLLHGKFFQLWRQKKYVHSKFQSEFSCTYVNEYI